MEEIDPITGEKRPCRCHEQSDSLAAGGDDAMPTSDEVEAALAELEGAAGAEDGLSLELAALGDALEGDDVFELERLRGEPTTSLFDLIALAERYPGLRISIGF